MPGDIENTIFSQIESSTGESFDSEDTAATVDTGTDLEQDQVTRQLKQRDSFDELVDEPTKEKASPPKKAESKGPAKDEKRPLKEQVPDKSHHEAHAERRLQSQVDRLRGVSKSLEARNQELTRQVAETKALNGIPQQFNLSNDEVVGGLEIIHMMKSNPAQAARKVVELAISRGANLRDIVNDEFVPQIQLGAVQQLLDERLGPVVKQQQAQAGQNQVQEQARMKTVQFLADYPDAEMHSEVVGKQIEHILNRYRERGVELDGYVAAEMAWNSVVQYAAQNKLDLSQPLLQQLEARQQQQRNGPVVQQRRPMPNGGNAPVQARSTVASADTSNRDIVRQAMIESGYTFN